VPQGESPAAFRGDRDMAEASAGRDGGEGSKGPGKGVIEGGGSGEEGGGAGGAEEGRRGMVGVGGTAPAWNDGCGRWV